jgi:hypothetical protein
MSKVQLLEATTDYGAVQDEIVAYRAEGERLAATLGNRGPLVLDADGRPDPAIVEAYRRTGFYVFEGVLERDELDDLEQDLAAVLDRAPATRGATVDRHGRPALGTDGTERNFGFVRPLSDPLGGTAAAHGRHQVKMIEPEAPADAPEWVLQIILGSLQYSEAHLRLYGHPGLLAFAEAVHGPDFTPFNEAIWIKHPGLGGSVAWHQDPWTHWDDPDLDGDTHGFNFMAQLYGCTAANGLWVLPGSHLRGKVDITELVAASGSERLEGAVPLICAPGDVAITNRQCVHGSFANTSPDPRVTFNFGFHRRSAVLGVTSGGVHNPTAVYDAERIRRRSEAIAWAIDARAQRFGAERRYAYAPFAGQEDRYRWHGDLSVLRDYNLLDLGI